MRGHFLTYFQSYLLSNYCRNLLQIKIEQLQVKLVSTKPKISAANIEIPCSPRKISANTQYKLYSIRIMEELFKQVSSTEASVDEDKTEKGDKKEQRHKKIEGWIIDELTFRKTNYEKQR